MTSTTTSDVENIGTPLAHALDFARDGKPVFPCDWRLDPKKPDSPSKRPLTSNGFKDATTDETQIRRWWTRWPKALIGMPTGSESGIAVLDTDIEIDPSTGEVVKDGEGALQAALAKRGWSLPETVRSRTSRGGRHRFFRCEPGFKCSTGILPGVDARAEGGYIIAPGSRGAAGGGWEFEDATDLIYTIDSAPPWLAHVFRTGRLPEPTEKSPKQAQGPIASAGTPSLPDGWDTTNPDDLAKALEGYWNADSYSDWVEAAIALHNHPQGRELWEGWAAQGATYSPEEAERKWTQTVPAKEITGRSILHRVPRELLQEWARGRTASGSPSVVPATITATQFIWQDAFSIPPRQWLYGRHLIRKFVSATVAPGGTGKSALAIVDALAMSTGRGLIGAEPAAPLRVWYWCGEDPLEETHRRVAAACLHYGIKEADIGGRLFLDSGRNTPIRIALQTRNGFEIATGAVEAIVREARERDIDVLIIDPFVSSHRVSENDNNAMDAVVKAWASIADRANCAVELLHHARKTGGAEVTAEAGRGASSMVDATRSTRALNRMSPADAGRAGVSNHRLYFYVDGSCGKDNLAPPAAHRAWFQLVSVDLMNGHDFASGDSVGVVERWEWPGTVPDLPLETVRAIQTSVAGKGYRRDAQSKDWVGYAIAKILGLKLCVSDVDTGDVAEIERNRERVKGVIAYLLRSEVNALKVVFAADKKGRSRPCIEAVLAEIGDGNGADSDNLPTSPTFTPTLAGGSGDT